MKKKILQLLILTATLSIGGVSWATDTDSVKLITSVSAGSNSADILARKVAELYKQRTGKEMPVRNVTGGNHIPAVLAFKKESLAVFFGSSTVLVYNPAVMKNLPYQPSDFHVLREIGIAPLIIFTHKDSGINSLEDLIKGEKSINIGVEGMVSVANANGWKRNHNPNIKLINFRSINDVIINVTGKHIPVGVVPVLSDMVFDLADRKDLRILGHTGDKTLTVRNYTMRPAGIVLNSPSFFGGNWVITSPGDSAEHKKLRDDLTEIFKDPSIQNIISGAWPVRAVGTNDLNSLQQRAINNQDLLVIK